MSVSIKTVVATVNGTDYTLTYNNTSGAYEASITAPTKSSYNQTNHVYGVSVTATDIAGNKTTIDSTHTTFGSALKLRVKEKTAPIIAFTSPTTGAGLTNNKPTLTLSVTDNDSGVNLDTFTLKIDNGTAIGISACTKTTITNGFTVTYTPTTALSDGSHTITASVSDNDGNASTTASITIKVDTAPPTLTIASPANASYTNNSSCTVSGTTNDALSSPVTVAITLNGASAGSVTVGTDGLFSKTVTLASGENTIVVTSTDSLGKSTSVTRTVTLSTVAPEFTSVTVTPNPVDAGATYIISVKVG